MATGRGPDAMNAVCPYYTMYPLSFPAGILAGATAGTNVLDPFCGRGTTLFAARAAGLPSTGVDASPVAVAIARAKLARTDAGAVVALARDILGNTDPDPVPDGEFWDVAYAPTTLDAVLRLRAGLRGAGGDAADALRAIALGALHGPRPRSFASYWSNQMPRTFATKPAPAVRFWRERGMLPPEVDVLAVVAHRAARFLHEIPPAVGGAVIHGDARTADLPRGAFDRIVTSPPYYGMRSYVPDQWLRMWFLGGPPGPTYVQPGQIGCEGNAGPAAFAAEIRKAWANAAAACRPGARMAVRFGALRSRPSDPEALLRLSLAGTPWRIDGVAPVPSMRPGRRIADMMGERARGSGAAVAEIDLACSLAA